MKNPERLTAPPMATKIGYTCAFRESEFRLVSRSMVDSISFIHSFFPGCTATEASRGEDDDREKETENPSPSDAVSLTPYPSRASERVERRTIDRHALARNPPPRFNDE